VYEADFNFNQKVVAIMGLAFKKRTNDMRDSAALKAVEALLARGVKEIRAYDPLAMDDAQSYWFNPDKNHLFSRITYHESPKEAIKGSDALFISTDWEEFRGLSRTIESTVQPPYLVIDGRRMLPDFEALVNKGYDYLSVGSPLVQKPTVAASSPNGVAHGKLAKERA
jgi:UDPglucose 6-dehydrogenase